MAITGNTIDLTWEASTDNIEVVGYEIFQDGTLAYTTLGTELTLTVINLTPVTEYSFLARAYDAQGNRSAFSNVVIESTLEADAYFFDDYPDAEAIYSFFQLHINGTNSVQIRRSSDNATTDIILDSANGQDASLNSLVTAGGTLGAWTGTDDLFVKTFYDQVNSNDVTQTTNSAQPQLAIAGVLITNDGKVAIDSNGATRYLFTNTASLGLGATSPITLMAIAKRDVLNEATNATFFGCGSTVGTGGTVIRMFSDAAGYGTRYNTGNIIMDNARLPVRTSNFLMTAFYDGSSDYDTSEIWANRVPGVFVSSADSATKNMGSNGIGIFCMYSTSGLSYFYDGRFSGGVIFSADMRTDRVTIESYLMGVGVYDIDEDDTTNPTNPVLSTGAIDDTSIIVNWTASTDASGIKDYKIFLNSSLYSTVGSGNLTKTITGLTPETQYSIYVKATDRWLYIANSNVVTPSTIATPDNENPVIGTISNPTSIGDNQMTLTWTAATDNIGVTDYKLYKSTTSSSSGFDSGTSLGNVLTTTPTGLIDFTDYWWKIKAFDAASNSSADSNVVTGKTTDGIKPTAPVASYDSSTETSITFTWTLSTDNSGTVPNYLVFKDGVWNGSTLGQIFTHTWTGLTVNTSYDMYVRGKDSSGNQSSNSNTVTHTTPDLTAPTIGTLSYGTVTETTVILNWTSASDNVGVTNYKVYKNGSLLTTLGNQTSYIATGLASGTQYSFKITAGDAASNWSSDSNTVTPTTASSFFVVNLTAVGKSSSISACFETGGQVLYTDTSGTPGLGDNIYTDSNGSTAFDGDLLWWKDLDNNNALEINASGEIIDTSGC